MLKVNIVQDQIFYIGFCKKVENKIKLKTMNDDCTSDFDYESGLECKPNKCSYSGTCGSDYSPVRNSNGGWRCKKDEYKGLCYYEKKEDSSFLYNSGAEYFQVCGKITFDKSSESGDHVKYKHIKIESVYKGSVDDREFVLDIKPCVISEFFKILIPVFITILIFSFGFVINIF